MPIAKQDKETLLFHLYQVVECLEDAPVDFLGTGDNSQAAENEENKWSAKWRTSAMRLRSIIESL